ncbi:MAG: leucine-rich repeat protein [Clostridiales bacterium]|nr:leucine-rich repeat protein [Clostridiales bacterium]
MKKFMAILISVCMITTVMPISVYADTGVSAAEAGEGLSELYREEAQSGKELEESVNCCIIVKANRKPEMYGDAEYVKGTDKIYFYQYSSTDEAEKALEYYQSLNYVQWAEYDGIVESQSLSYGTDMMGGSEAIEYAENNLPLTQEINIALIDDGINFHLNRFTQTGRVIDSGVNYSSTGSEDSAQQDVGGNYHGSNITSILLDNTTDNINIIGYKVLNRDGSGTYSAVALGINKAVEDGVDVINLSLGDDNESELISEAVKNAVAEGIVVVASAGNERDDVSNYYPAAMDEVFTVGAVDYNGNPAFFSNYGEEIDFVAPGYNIELWGNKGLSKTEPDYGSGTSFSAPYISAAAAMVLSKNSDLSVEEVKEILISSCVTQDEMTYKSEYYTSVYISNSTLADNTGLGYYPDSDELFYSYGMPQIQYAVGLSERCSSPVFSVSSSVNIGEFELTLTADDGDEIYYVTDEEYPSKNNGTLYTDPITVSSTQCIRAIAYNDNKIKSVPSQEEYRVQYLADESEFTIDSRGYITGYTGNDSEIIVPNTVDGITVIGVAEKAFYDSYDPNDELQAEQETGNHIIGITLPDTVTEIEDNAFFSYVLKYFTATGLKIVGEFALNAPLVYLEAPNIETVGYAGLYETNLESLYLPNLTYADNGAFSCNPYLEYVDLPALVSADINLFFECYRVYEIRLENVEVMQESSFYRCYQLKKVYLPKLKEITKTARTDTGFFYQCSSLETIDLPSLETIDNNTKNFFYGCSSLKSAYIPKLTYICSQMFYNCYLLSTVDLSSADYVGYLSFGNTVSLEYLNLPEALKIISMAFTNSALKAVDIPKAEEIGAYVFAAYDKMSDTYFVNTNLVYLNAVNTLTLNDYSLSYVGAVTELDLPNLTTIGENAFYESTINYLYAPSLETAESLLTADDSVVVTSASLTNCSYDASNATLTIQGERDSYAEDYANSYNLEFIDVNDMGRSIRVTDAGLRFGYSFYDTQGKDVEEYGFIYTNKEADRSLLKTENVDDSSVLQLKAKNYIHRENGTTTFNLVFIGIPQSAYDTQISARAYVVIDGKYYYSEILKGSFDEVTQLVLADDEIDEATKNALNNLLNKGV